MKTIKKIGNIIWGIVYGAGAFIGTLCILPILLVIGIFKTLYNGRS